MNSKNVHDQDKPSQPTPLSPTTNDSSNKTKSTSDNSTDKEESTTSTNRTITTIGSIPSSEKTSDKEEEKSSTTTSKTNEENLHDQEVEATKQLEQTTTNSKETNESKVDQGTSKSTNQDIESKGSHTDAEQSTTNSGNTSSSSSTSKKNKKDTDLSTAASTLASISTSIASDSDNDKTIEFKTPIPRDDPDYQYVSNFKKPKSNHSTRDSISSSMYGGKSPRNVDQRSKHLPPTVKTINVNYKPTKEQRKRFKTLPKSDLEPDERPEDYHQTEVDKLMKMQMNKLACKYIFQIDNSLIITKDKKIPLPTNANLYYSPKLYPLEMLALDEMKKDTNIQDFITKIRRKKNQWHKFPAIFITRFKKFIKDQNLAIAYYYMDFHAIRYDLATKELMGICYYDGTKVYEEPLNKEIIITVDKWHKQYMVAKTNAGDEIPLRIGKGDITSKAITKSTNAQDKCNATSTYTTLNNQHVLYNNSIHHASNTSTQHIPPENQPIEPSQQKYVQGSKNKCLEYSLYNCMETQKKLFQHTYNNNNMDTTFDNTITDLEKAISSSTGKNDTLHVIKVTLQAHGWKTTNIPKAQKYLLTNTRLFLEHTEQHKDRIFSAQLKDDAGNNNHWISVTCSKIHNAQWDEPIQVTEENLKQCTGNRLFRGFVKIIW